MLAFTEGGDPTDGFTGVAISPDGSRFATGSELFSLYGNASNVFSIAFSPDGDRLVTAGADGSVRTYTAQLDELVAHARARVTRTLTDQECRRLLHVRTCP